jgi:hypothetical protein
MQAFRSHDGMDETKVRAVIEAAVPIIAADAERRVRAETVAEALAKMTPDQVRDAFGARCWGCGGPTPCHCQNDE